MASNISPLSLETNLISRRLTDRNDFSAVHDLSGGYSKLMSLINILNKESGPKSINTEQYEKSFIVNDYVIAMIGSAPVQVGNTVVVGLADSTYNNFREWDLVTGANTEIQGIVVSSSAGTVTLEPAPGGTTIAQMLSEFVANTYLKVYGSAHPLRNSTGRKPLYIFPDVDYNLTQVVRESNYLSRRDRGKTRVMYDGEMWWGGQQKEAVDRLLKNMENMALMGRRGQSTVNGEVVNQAGGIEWAIKERPIGQVVHYALPTLPSLNTFEKFLADVDDRRVRKGPKFLLMGKGILSYIQNNFTQGFIENAGKLNTFGGEDVSGLNIMQYHVAGLEYYFMELPLLNDPFYFPEQSILSNALYRKKQYTAYCLDLDPIPVRGGSGTAPAIEKVYWGDSEYYECFVPGIDSSPSSGITNEQIMEMSVNRTATDVDNSSYHVLTECAHDMIGQFSGMIELTQ